MEFPPPWPVVIVVGDWLVIWVHGKGPEPVNLDVVAHLHRQANHHDPCAQPYHLQAWPPPEFCQISQVLRIVGDGTKRAVIQGVVGTQGDGCVSLVGEGRQQQQSIFLGV